MTTRYAEQKRSYRARAASRGSKRAKVADRPHFIAVDGEGFNEGDFITIEVGDEKRIYTAQEHNYALLMASDGSKAYNPTGPLATAQCLNFLCDIARDNPKSILVGFSTSYDVCHMLGHSLERDEVAELLRGGDGLSRRILDISMENHDYRIEYRPRKSLTIWRWEAGADKYEEKTKKDGSTYWKATPHDHAVLWDVWGFFQSSFVNALKEWLPSHPAVKSIAEMKDKRSVFDRGDISEIIKYTTSELHCLVTLMDAVADSLTAQELKIVRWDGAGAIAGALFKKHTIKEHMAPCPPAVFDAARIAYSGGHIEALKLGTHDGPVHSYDINSAYPEWFRKLPSLTTGIWQHGASATPPTGFTLVRVQFSFRHGMPFYPLFHRSADGSIKYPRIGEGWYWWPEYEAAKEYAAFHGCDYLSVIEWHHYNNSANESPFSWIETAYARRQEIVAESKRTGVPNGEEKTIKLGINSCYGKTAQQVGARWVDGEIVGPAYFQIEWAGYVTAGCRSQIMKAAIPKAHAIISFATDGIFSLEPLDLYVPPTKILGAWEYKLYHGMVIVMPGVYWLKDEPSPKNPTGMKHYSRGFKKEDIEDVSVIQDAWRKRNTKISMRQTRMITLGAASMSENFWKMRGMFVDTERDLQLNGRNSKRYPVSLSQCAPWREMVNTWPQSLDERIEGDELMSAQYPIDWLEIDDVDQDRTAPPLTDSGAASFLMRDDGALV